MRLRILTEDVLPEYLNMLFGLDSAQRWFERYSYGTTMPGIDEMTLGMFPIPLIDIKEQEIVVREYNKFLELSDDGSSAIRASTTLIKSLINQVF